MDGPASMGIDDGARVSGGSVAEGFFLKVKDAIEQCKELSARGIVGELGIEAGDHF